MLGEAFLIEFLFKEQKYTKIYKELTCKKISDDEKDNWKNQLFITEDILDTKDNSILPDKMGKQDKFVKEILIKQSNDTNKIKALDEMTLSKCKSESLPENVSVALPIPKREQYDGKQLDLYRSWSCTSICQNYPDLHIGGDYVGNMRDLDCFVEHIQDDTLSILLSIDIPWCNTPTIESLEKLIASKNIIGDEIREKSMLFYNQPFSNSLLNSYVREKVDELYKQVLEENLIRCSSITNIMASNWLMNNVNQICLQSFQEQNVETYIVDEDFPYSLSVCSFQNFPHGISSKFSTPNLQISNQKSREHVSYLQTMGELI
ncbi:TLR adapter interacting with SLC15A4 on the lysosome-like [Sorex fumeus]|uniref:TLR adapter interacting with SLC15A4 on the lysosome-like n=1 Tax=Sorex fumeus TaxID=62283 RepID=UPI0024AC9E37|nr:TLR adapter interacting with SLC15A4 on the lysosome-like [Sorex fumeus]